MQAALTSHRQLRSLEHSEPGECHTEYEELGTEWSIGILRHLAASCTLKLNYWVVDHHKVDASNYIC